MHLIKNHVAGMNRYWKQIIQWQGHEKGYGIRFDEEQIKKKMNEIKNRKKQEQKDKNKLKIKEEFMKDYKLEKVRPEVRKFRQQTKSEGLFTFADQSLDDKSTAIQISGFTEQAIELDGLKYPPSIILTPFQSFLWEIKSIKKVTKENMKIIELFHPQPFYVMVGCKDPTQFPGDVQRYISQTHGNFSVLPIFEAISTFNIIANEEMPVMAFIKLD